MSKTLPRVYNAQSCAAARQVLSRIGDKWSVLVVLILENGTRRFSDIAHQIDGISQRMLTLTLRALERDGLLTRTVEAAVPPRVYYTLTPLGESLLAPIRAMTTWGEDHQADITAAQQRYDAAKKDQDAD